MIFFGRPLFAFWRLQMVFHRSERMSSKRSRGWRGRPLGQPGDFPCDLHMRVGVPITAKRFCMPWHTRPGESLVCGFCQGSGLSCTNGRASQSSQVRKGIRSLQRSHCCGVESMGRVQCSRPLANDTSDPPGSAGHTGSTTTGQVGFPLARQTTGFLACGDCQELTGVPPERRSCGSPRLY